MWSAEALTDQDGFAWTTSIMDENCLSTWFLTFWHNSFYFRQSIRTLGDGGKDCTFTSVPNKDSQAYTETVLVATHSQPSYIQRISAQLPMLFFIDLIYAYFLEINRESKEKIFNSYWENKKLNGYRRQNV